MGTKEEIVAIWETLPEKVGEKDWYKLLAIAQKAVVLLSEPPRLVCDDTLEAVAKMLEEKASVLSRRKEDADADNREVLSGMLRAREDELLLTVIKIRAMKGTEL